MEPVVWGFIGSVTGTIVGACVSLATSTINSRNSLKIQTASKELDRAEKFNDFQIETLLTVQGELQDFIRLMVRGYLSDMKASREGAQWEKNIFDEDFDEKLRSSAQKMSSTIERISNDVLRNEIKEIKAMIVSVYMSESKDEAKRLFSEASETYSTLMEKIGIVLRSHY